MSSIDFFVHPWPALAMIIMAVNDHWLKARWPSWFTGKLSDFAGVFYFPLLLIAFFCLFMNYVVRVQPSRKLTRLNLAVAMTLTVLLMAVVKLSAPAANRVSELFSKWLFATQITPDPTDLIALVMLFFTYRHAQRFFADQPAAQK